MVESKLEKIRVSLRKDDPQGVVTDGLVAIKKEDLEKVVGTKAAAMFEEKRADLEDKSITGLLKVLSGDEEGKELAEKYKDKLTILKAAQDKQIASAIEKAEANRKSIEQTGDRFDGEKATHNERWQAKISKSEKLGDEKLSDFDEDMRIKSDRFNIMRNVMLKSKEKTMDDVVATKAYKSLMSLLVKAGYDETAGSGLEWMPQILSSRLIEFMEVSNDFKIPMLFEQIQMPSAVFKIPRETSAVTAYKGAIGGATTESHAGTGEAQFTAQKIIGYTLLSYEAEEDMIIPAMPLIERRLVKAITKGSADAIINGDNGAVHMDTDSRGVNDRRQLFDGLRRLCQTNGANWQYNVNAVWTQELFRKWQNVMGEEMSDAESDWKFLLPKNSYNQIRNLAEVRTLDKFGANATIVKGVLTDIDGIDVVRTSLLRAAQASGIVASTAASNDKDQALVVYTPAFGFGIRRTMLLEQDRNIRTQNIDVVGSMRIDFQSLIRANAADPVSVVQARNITRW